MIEYKYAKDACGLALEAVAKLTQILDVCKDRCSKEEYEQLRKGVGLSIGRIQTDVLDYIILSHPELDDLK